MEQYLEAAGIPNAAEITTRLVEQEVVLGDFVALTEENLKELGFDKMGPRMRLLKYISENPPTASARLNSNPSAPQRNKSTSSTTSVELPSKPQRNTSTSSITSVELLQKPGKLTSTEFMQIFNEYETEGQISHENVDVFVTELVKARAGDGEAAKEEVGSIGRILRKRHSTTSGGISMAAMQSLLNVEECFLLQLKNKRTNITSTDFFRIWEHYDADLNGYVQSEELEAFLRDLLIEKKTVQAYAENNEGEVKVSGSDVKEYCQTLLEMFDTDGDGRVSIGELSVVLSVENNFLDKLKNKTNLTRKQFDKVFNHYDRDHTGVIDGCKLKALAWDHLRSFDDVIRINMADVNVCEAAMLEEAGSKGEKTMTPLQLATLLQMTNLF